MNCGLPFACTCLLCELCHSFLHTCREEICRLLCNGLRLFTVYMHYLPPKPLLFINLSKNSSILKIFRENSHFRFQEKQFKRGPPDLPVSQYFIKIKFFVLSFKIFCEYSSFTVVSLFSSLVSKYYLRSLYPYLQNSLCVFQRQNIIFVLLVHIFNIFCVYSNIRILSSFHIAKCQIILGYTYWRDC